MSTDLSGVAVIPSRYGSACGGAEWLAFSLHDSEFLPDAPWGDDNQCQLFFNEDGFADSVLADADGWGRDFWAETLEERERFLKNGKLMIGLGRTSKEALDDLEAKIPGATDCLKE